MKRHLRYYRIAWVNHDLSAGLSVFLVALPLCLGIALASGAPLYAGLVSGVIGGLVVPIISRSALGVSGPAAGLSTVVAAALIATGNYSVFLLSVLICGGCQIVFGILKLGTIASYFPSAVIKGMLAAIGILLLSKQIPLALGLENPDFWTSVFFGNNFITGMRSLGQYISAGSVIIAVVSLLLLILLQQSRSKKLKLVPAPLVVVIAGILINFLFMLFAPSYALKPTQLVAIPNEIFQSVTYPEFSDLFTHTEVWKYGLLLGVLATLETVLSVEAVDKLDPHNRITPVNRELIAQGTGNIVCGLLGGLPITAVIVRGAANVDAGAKSNLSAMTHGLFLLLTVVLIPSLLNYIPYASLAAILLVTGYNLTKPKLYAHQWALGWKQFAPFVITILVILSTDLLIGVSIGLLLSIYFIVQNNFKAEYRIQKSKEHETDVYVIKLNSNVTFLNKVNLKKALDVIPHYSKLTIDGSDCNFIDYDILEIISEFHSKAKDRHIEVHLNSIEKVNVTALH